MTVLALLSAVACDDSGAPTGAADVASSPVSSEEASPNPSVGSTAVAGTPSPTPGPGSVVVSEEPTTGTAACGEPIEDPGALLERHVPSPGFPSDPAPLPIDIDVRGDHLTYTIVNPEDESALVAGFGALVTPHGDFYWFDAEREVAPEDAATAGQVAAPPTRVDTEPVALNLDPGERSNPYTVGLPPELPGGSYVMAVPLTRGAVQGPQGLAVGTFRHSPTAPTS